MRLGPSIKQVLDTIEPIYSGTIPRKKLLSKLNSNFGKSSLVFKSRPRKFCISNWVYVAGIFDSSCNVREVSLIHAPNLKEIFVNDLIEFSFLITQTIKHETIHQRQFKYKHDKLYKVSKRSYVDKFKLQEERYLADPEEIQAYAHDIALEIKFFYPTCNPYDVLERISRTRKLPSYNYYQSTFRNKPWDPIRQSLLKQTLKWIPHVTL